MLAVRIHAQGMGEALGFSLAQAMENRGTLPPVLGQYEDP